MFNFCVSCYYTKKRQSSLFYKIVLGYWLTKRYDYVLVTFNAFWAIDIFDATWSSGKKWPSNQVLTCPNPWNALYPTFCLSSDEKEKLNIPVIYSTEQVQRVFEKPVFGDKKKFEDKNWSYFYGEREKGEGICLPSPSVIATLSSGVSNTRHAGHMWADRCICAARSIPKTVKIINFNQIWLILRAFLVNWGTQKLFSNKLRLAEHFFFRIWPFDKFEFETLALVNEQKFWSCVEIFCFDPRS